MSAIPDYKTKNVNNFLAYPVERTDDTLFTDEEYFQFKGGMKNFYWRLGSSLSAVVFYLTITGRFIEVLRFNITGKTFIGCNITFFSIYFLLQKSINDKNGFTDRSNMHNHAFVYRTLINWQLMINDKKKPKFH